MFTRSDYMNKVCTHSQYYGQFVTPVIVRALKTSSFIDDIMRSTCMHFNDIPLRCWDSMSEAYRPSIPNEYGDGKRYYSLAGGVCIFKEAARKIRDGIV